MAEKNSRIIPIQWVQTIKEDETYEFNPDPNVYSTEKNISSTSVITLQSTVIDGIDTTNRFLYNRAGTAVLSWESLNLTDQYGVGSIDWGGRVLVSTGGNRVLNWQNDLNLISPVYYTSEIVDITQNIFSATSSYAGKTIQGSSSAALYNVVAYDKDTFTWNPVSTKSTQATYVLGIWLPGNLVLLEGELVVHDDYGTFGPYIAGHIGGAPIYLQSDGVGVMDCTPPTVPPNIVRVLGYTYYKNTTSGGDWIMKFSPQDYISSPTIPASASYATSASYALTAQTLLGSVTSASYAQTASYVQTAQTASFFSGTVVSASYAQTASFVQNAQTSSYLSNLESELNNVLIFNLFIS